MKGYLKAFAYELRHCGGTRQSFVPLLVFLLRKKSSQPLCGVFHPQHVRQQAPTTKVRYFLLRNVLNINNINIWVWS
jgi:hypothetical protein